MTVFKNLINHKYSLAVIGLGYVGLPLAVAFSKKVTVVGFDNNANKIEAYKNGHDYTHEVGDEELAKANVHFTSDEADIKNAGFIIVAVPTPVDNNNLPDLGHLESACEIVGRNLSRGAIVVFESTVYSGVTEDICAPIMEKASGLVCGKDFKIGYSPERINPGDKVHRLENIVKVVAGMDDETTDEIANIYELIIDAGTFKAKSIKVAELAKLEENAQRDINIAFMNELAMIHKTLDVDTIDVINAMNTKWNSLGFYPGLVGGHCISVDPYYLIYKAEREDYHSSISVAGRKTNNDMAAYVADSTVKQMIKANQLIKEAKVYIFGVTFKGNCPDIRNTLVLKIIHHLAKYEIYPEIVDPEADASELQKYHGIQLTPMSEVKDADCIIFAVDHDVFKNLDNTEIDSFFKRENNQTSVVVDVKNIFRRSAFENREYLYWCL